MPCRGPDDELYSEIDEKQGKIDRLTDLLCELCGKAEKDANFKLPGRHQKWWAQHQELDRSRKQADFQRERESLQALEVKAEQTRKEIEATKIRLNQAAK